MWGGHCRGVLSLAGSGSQVKFWHGDVPVVKDLEWRSRAWALSLSRLDEGLNPVVLGELTWPWQCRNIPCPQVLLGGLG